MKKCQNIHHLKLGGKADIFVKIYDESHLRYVLKLSKSYDIPIFVLGNGSNLLVTDKGIRGIVCKININKFEIKEDGNCVFVTVGSGEKNGFISQKLLNLGITGFEFAARNSRKYWWRNQNECWCLWK